MIPRSRWKRIAAATMLAGMAANGCAVYAAEVQPITATPETAQAEAATPETAAADIPAMTSLYAGTGDAVDLDTDEPDYSQGDKSVDIERQAFEPDQTKYYGTATFYDYYGDYERLGNKLSTLKDMSRDEAIQTLKDCGLLADAQNDQAATQWNLAIDDYFKEVTDRDGFTIDPLYFGGARYFYGYIGSKYSGGDSKLYNYSAKRTCGNGYSGAKINKKNNSGYAYFPNQGIVADTLGENDQLLLKTSNGGTTVAPYFSRDVVRNEGKKLEKGPNGYVYDNVSFPFTWDEGSSTWLFDSTEDGAQIKQDPNTDNYFIDDSGDPVQYGSGKYFFPFNEAGMEVKAEEAYKLNYMFGMQLELPFNLTANKMSTAIDENGKEKDVNTVFRFAGDDDIWVYIDGHLVLDMGGSHGTVAGAIDFTTGKYMVSGKWDGKSTTAAAMSNKEFWEDTVNGITEDYIAQNKDYCDYGDLAAKLGGQELTTGVRHTIQIFYMERGWDQSNLKMSFNFSQDSRVTVTKTTDLSGMNKELFTDVYAKVTEELRNVAFPFGVKNQRTFDNNHVSKIENSELESAAGKVYTHKLADGTAQEETLKDSGTGAGVFELKDGEQAIFSNQFAYDSYLQVAEQSKEGETRFTPTWSLTETSLTGQTVSVTKGQAELADDEEPQGGSNTQLKDVPGTTPYDKRETEVSRNPVDAKSLLLRPYGNKGEKVGVQIDFTNHLLVGELTLNKQLADGTLPTKDRFTLLVKFEDVAGVKGATQYTTVTLDPDNHYTKTLTGIPYGTKYTVYEVQQEGWRLEKILPENSTNSLTEVDGQPVYDLCHTGTIAAETDNKVEVTFQNSRVPLPVPTPATTPTPKPVVITTPNPPSTPTQTPANTPAQPTQTPANTPTQTPPQPTQTPAGTPTQTPPQPTQTPVSTPTQTPPQPTQTPANTPTQTPAATPTQTPASTPTQTPAATPTQTPASTPTQTPAATPTQTPAATPTQTPAATPTATPAETPAPTATPVATATPAAPSAPTSTPPAGTTSTPEPAQTPTATAVPIPQTSDSFPLFLLGTLTLCSAAALFGLLWYGRKKKF